MRQEPTTDELPIAPGETVEIPDGRETVELPGARPTDPSQARTTELPAARTTGRPGGEVAGRPGKSPDGGAADGPSHEGESPNTRAIEPAGGYGREVPGRQVEPAGARTPEPSGSRGGGSPNNLATESPGGRHRPETVLQQAEPAPRKKARFWRELTGALAAGTVLLTLTVLVLQVVAWVNGMPGLGISVLVGHLGGAVLAVITQREVDRREGKTALLAGLGVVLTVVVVLVLFWWM